MDELLDEVEEAVANKILTLVGERAGFKRPPTKDWLLADGDTRERYEWLIEDLITAAENVVETALGRHDTPREARTEISKQITKTRQLREEEQLIRIKPILHNSWVRGPCVVKRSDPNWTDGEGWVLEWKVSQLETYIPNLDTLKRVIDFPLSRLDSLADKPPADAIDIFSEIGPFGYFFQNPSEFITFFGDARGKRVKSVIMPQSRRTFRHFPQHDSFRPISSIPQRMYFGSEAEPLAIEYETYWYWYHNRKVKPVPPWHERVFSGYREFWPLLHRDISRIQRADVFDMLEQLSRTNLEIVRDPNDNLSIGPRFTCLYEMLMFLQVGNQFNDGLPKRRCPICNDLFTAYGKKIYCGDKCRKKRYDKEKRQR